MFTEKLEKCKLYIGFGGTDNATITINETSND